MYKVGALILLMIISFASYAQDDDIPDYRSKKDLYKKITDKDLRSDLAAFTLSSLDEALAKEPLPQLPLIEYKNDLIRFAGDNVAVTIVAGTFDKTKHKLLYYDEKYLTKIDIKPFFSSKLGATPVRTIQSVTVVVGSDTIHLPDAAFSDLYDPMFCQGNTNSNTAKCNTAVYLSKDGRKIYIYMLNSSDTKNGYEVTWVIQDKIYIRRVVDYGF